MDRKTMLMDYIKQEFLHGRQADLDENDDLLNSGILNSLAILQLVAHIEEQMGLEVPVEDVVYENFQSVAALNAYLESQS
jgi:acyl carrier protein